VETNRDNLEEPMGDVHTCQSCGDLFYGEVTLCPECDLELCGDCLKNCINCGKVGCISCLQYDSEQGEYFCGEECRKEWELK